MKILCIAILIFASFCSSPSGVKFQAVASRSASDGHNIPQIQTNDTIKNRIYDFCLKAGKLVGLEDIQAGFEGKQIRLWFRYSMSDSGKVLIFRNQKGVWNSAFYYLKFKYDENSNLKAIDKKMEVGKPKSNRETLIAELDSLSNFGMKDYKQFPKYEDCMDGDGISIEIAKESSHLIYEYPCFDLNERTITEVSNLKIILMRIQSEFGYRLFPRPQFKTRK